MTPHVVYNDDDAEAIKRNEAARMHWCLADVIDLYGSEGGLRGRKDDWSDAETQVIYPDAQPGVPRPRPRPNGANHPEKTPTPVRAPVRLDVPPPPGDRAPDAPTPSDQSNYQPAPPGNGLNVGGQRSGLAPAAWTSGPYGQPNQVTPARYDRPEAAAPDEQARFVPNPWQRGLPPVQDRPQMPVQDQPFTNPVRGDYR